MCPLFIPLYAYKAMSQRIRTTIETSQSTVVLLAAPSVFRTQLERAIAALHLHVVSLDPREIVTSIRQESTRTLLSQCYVCLWVDIPIFVPQEEKIKHDEYVIATLKEYVRAPLHLVSFDTAYCRKNGREGKTPTIASSTLIDTVLRAFPRAISFRYSHVVYPYEGGLSVVVRFIQEKISQRKRFPLQGTWNPLWYGDVISHIITTLYDLSHSGGVYTGSQEISLKEFENELRSRAHRPGLYGQPVEFPFEFSKASGIGKMSISAMIEELVDTVPTEKALEATPSGEVAAIFPLKKQVPAKVIRSKKRQRTLVRRMLIGLGASLGAYAITAVLFFTLLGQVRTTIIETVHTQASHTWSQNVVRSLTWRLNVLESIARILPLPYSLVGLNLPREGVIAGIHSTQLFMESIQDFQQAGDLLGKKIAHTRDPRMTTTISNQQIGLLLDQSYKDLSSIQADISTGNPIFDSVFGVDGLSSSLVTSTSTLREAITQQKAVNALVDAFVDQSKKVSVALVSLDTTIARPLFGSPREIALLTIDQGKVTSTQIYQVDDLDAMLKGKVESPRELQAIGAPSTWKLSSGAWSADGPTAAKEIAWFLGKQLHQDVESILFVDQQTLTNTIAAATETQSSSMVLGATATDATLSRLLSVESQSGEENIASILSTLSSALNASQAVFYAKESGIAKTLHSLAWDGSIRTPTCPTQFSVERECVVMTRYFGEYDLIASGSAERPVAKNNQIHQLSLTREATIHTDIITYPKAGNNATTKIVKWLIDRDAAVSSLAINGQLLSISQGYLGTEFEKTSVTVPITLSTTQDNIISLVYSTHPIATRSSALAFFAQKQLGQTGDPFSLEVTYSKDFLPSIVAPKGLVERSGLSFTTTLTTSKLFAIGF